MLTMYKPGFHHRLKHTRGQLKEEGVILAPGIRGSAHNCLVSWPRACGEQSIMAEKVEQLNSAVKEAGGGQGVLHD